MNHTTTMRRQLSLVGAILASSTVSFAQSDCGRWMDLGPGLSLGRIHAMTAFDDGSGMKLYVGGTFRSIAGVQASNIARWDGTRWEALGAGVDDQVMALMPCEGCSRPTLIAAGDFVRAGSSVANGIAQWSDGAWSSLSTGMTQSGLNSWVADVAYLDSGSGSKFFAAGAFDTAGGIAAENIAMWDGTAWSSLGQGVDGVVTSLSSDVRTDRLYVGGAFFRAGGERIRDFAWWHAGSWDTAADPIASVRVHDMAFFDDGTTNLLYVAGNISAPFDDIGAWDGLAWADVGSEVSGVIHTIEPLRVDVLSRLFVGGSSGLAIDGEFARGPISWDGSQWRFVRGPSEIHGSVHAMAVYDAGNGPELYVGGDFTTSGEVRALSLVRWKPSPPCSADLDQDCLLSVFDFLAFQNLFDAGDLAADFDGDGSLTIFDFLAFQNEFDAGCA